MQERNQLTASPVMKIAEVAQALNCSPRTISRMCERGELVACKVGNQWRVSRHALEEHINGGCIDEEQSQVCY